jgi:hypothetical protein
MGFTPPALQKLGFDALSATPGIPAGGTTGQVLTKQSATDYQVHWDDIVQIGNAIPNGSEGSVLFIDSSNQLAEDGDLTYFPATSTFSTGTGVFNQVDLKNSANGFKSTLDHSGITADRSVVVPNKSGTIAFLDDIGGGASLSPSYHLTDQASATTIYSGINSASSSTADTNWSITKIVLSGNNRETRTVNTATGNWTDRASHSYSTSLAYSN